VSLVQRARVDELVEIEAQSRSAPLKFNIQEQQNLAPLHMCSAPE
jgi:hypothetical protein